MTRKLFSSSILVTIAFAAVSFCSAQSRAELEVYDLVNRERSHARLRNLAWDDRLGRLARDYSRQMARRGFFDHYDPEGRTVTDRARALRISNWSSIGENLFFCEAHPYFTQSAVRGWLKSRSHRTNMLDRTWTATGVGIATARDGSIYITQVFTHE